jgi:hypothetical protein
VSTKIFLREARWALICICFWLSSFNLTCWYSNRLRTQSIMSSALKSSPAFLCYLFPHWSWQRIRCMCRGITITFASTKPWVQTAVPPKTRKKEKERKNDIFIMNWFVCFKILGLRKIGIPTRLVCHFGISWLPKICKYYCYKTLVYVNMGSIQ